jgi:hypothetical protein
MFPFETGAALTEIIFWPAKSMKLTGKPIAAMCEIIFFVPNQ